MRSNLVRFAESNPDAIIKTEKVRNCQPLLRAFYLNGNKKQISIKNVKSQDVHEKVGLSVAWLVLSLVFFACV
jgi:hypothetical protein